MNLASVIASFSTGSYIVTRRPVPVYEPDGRLQAETTTTLTITAAVQPLQGGPELQRLSEGNRLTDVRVIFTTTLLQANPADVVAIDGASWEVQSVENWYPVAGFYRAVAQKTEH